MVSASFPPAVGGAEKQALELSAALLARGVSARVLTRRVPGRQKAERMRGVPVARLWCAGSGFVNAATFLASLFVHLLRTADSFDAIHVHLAGSPALAAALAGRLLGKPVFVKLGGGRGIGELAVSSRTLAGRLKLRCLALLKPRLVAVARELAEESAALLGPLPVHLLANGVDTERYRPAADKAALRRRLGWPDGLAFLYAGRFSWEKRLPWFVEVWSRAVPDAMAASFVAFVGEGPERPALEEAISKADGRCRAFVHAPIEDIETAYAAADVFILPSVSEGLSNALLEAMASGLAILGSRVGGTKEAVEEGKTGALFDADDAAGLERALRGFAADPASAARMGRAAREKAVASYSLARLAERYETLYAKAAA